MFRNIVVVFVVLLCCSTARSQDAQSDKLLNILQRELNREIAEFSKTSQQPYFIDYRVDDGEQINISAGFGSLIGSYAGRGRILHANVRIGDYLVDSTHPINDEAIDIYAMGTSSSLPVDDSEEAIRYALWEAMDGAYRLALRQLGAVRNAQITKKADKRPPDFSKEPVAKYYEPVGVPFDDLVNRQQWEDKMRRFSKLFLGDASIVECDVQFSFGRERRTYLSTEGTSIVQNTIGAYINVTASILANDGEVVPLHRSYYAPTPAELPPDQTIDNDIREMIVILQKLKTAPLAEPYTGPAVLDGSVAGVFFHEIFGHRVEGHRLRSESDGQTFKARVDQRILPESISVYSDPTVKKFGGKLLNGVYEYDDEGVKSRKVTIVEKGTLKNFLMSRLPLDNFPSSNGHGRATSGMGAVSRQSNLFIEASKTRSSTELRQMLIKECQKQKRQYGYYFKRVIGGFTLTDRYNPNAFNIFPTEVYRVYVDGRPDELVRGVDLIGTPLAMFAEITAVGDTHDVFTGFCGAESGFIPVSAISPALFVRRIETQKKPRNKVEEPILDAPSPAPPKPNN